MSLRHSLESPSALLDPETLEDLWELCDAGDPSFLLQSIRLFEDRCRVCEHDLDKAYAYGDRMLLSNTAHALAGSASIIGAFKLHDCAAELETRQELPWDSVAALLVELHAICDQTRLALQQEERRVVGR